MDNQVITTNQPEAIGQESALSIGVSTAAKAGIEAQLMLADARPRDEEKALGKILISCDRPRLAEAAAYEYSKGGQPISGPSIRLLEVIAQKWGNLNWGFQELSRKNGESTCLCYAIDLESNSRVERLIVIRHVIDTKRGPKRLTDEREIYEWLANQCQRRVRTCLENIIPKDIIEEALDACQKALKTSVQISQELISRLLDAFQEFKVTKEMLEKFIQRKFDVDHVTPGNIVRLKKIYTALKDGVAEVKDWFEVETVKEPKSSDVVTKAVNGKAEKASVPDIEQKASPVGKKPKKAEPEPVEQPGGMVHPDWSDDYQADLFGCKNADEVRAIKEQYENVEDHQFNQFVNFYAMQRIKELASESEPAATTTG